MVHEPVADSAWSRTARINSMFVVSTTMAHHCVEAGHITIYLPIRVVSPTCETLFLIQPAKTCATASAPLVEARRVFRVAHVNRSSALPSNVGW